MLKNKELNKVEILYEKTFFRIINSLPMILIPLILVIDPPLIEEAHRNFYIQGRLCLELFFSILFILNLIKPKNWHLVAFYGGMGVYSIFGQLFLPSYYLVYMETLLPLALFFPMREKSFYIVTALSFAGMVYAINHSGTSYSTDLIFSQRFHFDATIAIAITTLLSVLGYHFITRVRREKDILSAKFIDIGKNTSSLIHDFKGLLGTPMMYSQMLEKDKESYDERTQTIITNLNEDFAFLKKFVDETNHLNNLKEHKDTFELDSIITSLKVILRSSLRGIEVENKDNPTLNFSQNLLLKVLYNVFINCIESQNENHKLKIMVVYCKEKSSILIKDNGVGFSPEALNQLNANGLVDSTKANGSAIGTLIIKDLISSVGGKVSFYNTESGACVQLKFPSGTFV
jgi:signal transduction histidine kinase